MNRNKQVVVSQLVNVVFNSLFDKSQALLHEILVEHSKKHKPYFQYKGQRYFMPPGIRELPPPLDEALHSKMDAYIQYRDEVSDDVSLVQGYLNAACNAVQDVTQLYFVLPDTLHGYLERMRIPRGNSDGINFDVLQWAEEGRTALVKRLLDNTLES